MKVAVESYSTINRPNYRSKKKHRTRLNMEERTVTITSGGRGPNSSPIFEIDGPTFRAFMRLRTSLLGYKSVREACEACDVPYADLNQALSRGRAAFHWFEKALGVCGYAFEEWDDFASMWDKLSEGFEEVTAVPTHEELEALLEEVKTAIGPAQNGQTLRSYREASDMSLADVAEEQGVSRNAVHMWEKKGLKDKTRLASLADLYSCDPSDLED